jgi:hypothetical protein
MSFAQISPPDHGIGGASPTTGKEIKLGHELVSVGQPDTAVELSVDLRPDPNCKTTMAKS